MDTGEMVRERERLLAIQYGAEEMPKRLVGEDLECDDPADVEHWVEIYTELVGFTHSLLEAATQEGSVFGDCVSDRAPDLRALTLRARVQELHLNYWLERLNRIRADSGSGPPD